MVAGFPPLTDEEKKTLNQISQQRDPDVNLGDLIDDLITAVNGVGPQ